jgi:hypothetical protein
MEPGMSSSDTLLPRAEAAVSVSPTANSYSRARA